MNKLNSNFNFIVIYTQYTRISVGSSCSNYWYFKALKFEFNKSNINYVSNNNLQLGPQNSTWQKPTDPNPQQRSLNLPVSCHINFIPCIRMTGCVAPNEPYTHNLLSLSMRCGFSTPQLLRLSNVVRVSEFIKFFNANFIASMQTKRPGFVALIFSDWKIV